MSDDTATRRSCDGTGRGESTTNTKSVTVNGEDGEEGGSVKVLYYGDKKYKIEISNAAEDIDKIVDPTMRIMAQKNEITAQSKYYDVDQSMNPLKGDWVSCRYGGGKDFCETLGVIAR